MIASNLHGSNRLILKSVTRVFPACFAATLAGTVSLMMDSLLAGSLIGTLSIAAVAIGNPVINILKALVQTISCGAAVQITVNTGRGDQKEINRAYSMGVFGTLALGLVAMLICLTAAAPLVQLFGGASNEEAARQAAIYIATCSVSIVFSSINFYMGKVLSVYSCQKLVFVNALISVLGNLVFSVLFVKLLPEELAIAGLGLGTSLATVICCFVSFTIVRVKKLPLRLSLRTVKLKDAAEAIRLGIPSSGNSLADGVVSGIVNNIILAGFGGSTDALAVYTAVKAVFSFAQTTNMGAALATGPLFGLLYGARDRSGLCRTLREGFKVGLLFTVVWCVLLYALLPVLARFYGMEGNAVMRTGVVVCMLFTPVLLALRVMTQLFESTGKVGMGIAYSIIPDSVIYPLLLLLLMPKLGYMGIWLSLGGNGILFLLLMYLVRSAKNRTTKMTLDRMLCLDESIRDNVPRLDISISATTQDSSAYSEQVHSFLKQEAVSERCAYITALCLEELAMDFVQHTQDRQNKKEIVDIKLFSDEKTMRLVIRNAAAPYDPLQFDHETENENKIGIRLAQQVAEHIDYSYVFSLNIVTIDIAK